MKIVKIVGADCLCVSRDHSTCPVEDHINLWVMEQYGVNGSWTELLYLSRDRWLTSIFHTRSVGIDYCLMMPAWFNLGNEIGETLLIEGALQLFSTVIYVESLVSVQ